MKLRFPHQCRAIPAAGAAKIHEPDCRPRRAGRRRRPERARKGASRWPPAKSAAGKRRIRWASSMRRPGAHNAAFGSAGFPATIVARPEQSGILRRGWGGFNWHYGDF